MKSWGTFLLMGLLLAASGSILGCSKPGNSSADIRKAIEEHLASRPGLLSSDIVLDVKKVDVKGDVAEADVLFRSRKDPNASMAFHYQLHNDGKAWKVQEAAPNAGGTPHSELPPPDAMAPEGAPGGAGSDHAPSGESAPLPPGHPSVGGEKGGEKK